jgi:hypothetical protein
MELPIGGPQARTFAAALGEIEVVGVELGVLRNLFDKRSRNDGKTYGYCYHERWDIQYAVILKPDINKF